MPDLHELGEAIKRGDRDTAAALTKAAIETKIPAQEILDAMVGAMDIVGQRFQKNEIFVPEMLIAARAMKEAMGLLEPILVEAGITPVAKAVIGTVEGDLHDIGKNLVAMMWKGANFDVIDLGTNVSPQKFVDAVRTNNAQLVGLSALLTTTMPAIKKTVDAIKGAGLDVTKIVIGGAPVTQEYANEVGADGYAPDAASAVDVARSLL
ncbi:MAG: corrinoid protein [Pirellulaceae bacterium]|jgi:5-methyltetrahydrofolate--homocysteine methyltransferase|nr:corrinoid protein [Pirellulaceae bacterium]